MARMARGIMGLQDGERVSLEGWSSAFDDAKEAGHIGYSSGGYSMVHPKTVDHLVRQTFEDATGYEVSSADYGVTGCKGKYTNASWYGQWTLDPKDDSGMGISIIARMGKMPLSIGAGSRVFLCTNGMFNASDAHMRFPQVSSLQTYLQAILIEMGGQVGPMHTRRVAMREAMRGVQVTEAGAQRWLGELAWQRHIDADGPVILDALPENSIKRIAEDVVQPQHDAFLLEDGGRSLDTLYQASNYWARFTPHGQRMEALQAIDAYFQRLVEAPPAYLSA